MRSLALVVVVAAACNNDALPGLDLSAPIVDFSTANDLCTGSLTDPMNCGICGCPCPLGAICSDGTCANTCGLGFVACGPIDAGSFSWCPTTIVGCMNVKTDVDNCGGCGIKCCPGLQCSDGKCVPFDCSAGITECPITPPPTCVAGGACCIQSICADVRSDANNCGNCGAKCPTGRVCQNGSCT